MVLTYPLPVKFMEVNSIELLAHEHGCHTWPCAPVLAQFIYEHRTFIKGKHVLELGSGTAVPGMVAAKCGARVTLSDREGSPDLLKNLKKTCEMNRVPVAAEGEEAGPGAARIMGITWGVFSPELLALAPQDIVLASDCFYDVKDFEDIVATMSLILRRNSLGRIWVTYQERSRQGGGLLAGCCESSRISLGQGKWKSKGFPGVNEDYYLISLVQVKANHCSDRSLLPLLKRWGLKCRTIPPNFYPPAREEQAVRVSGLSDRLADSVHTIHTWEITRQDGTSDR